MALAGRLRGREPRRSQPTIERAVGQSRDLGPEAHAKLTGSTSRWWICLGHTPGDDRLERRENRTGQSGAPTIPWKLSADARRVGDRRACQGLETTAGAHNA